MVMGQVVITSRWGRGGRDRVSFTCISNSELWVLLQTSSCRGKSRHRSRNVAKEASLWGDVCGEGHLATPWVEALRLFHCCPEAAHGM